MANFSKLMITEKGKELLSEKLLSEKLLIYTRIAVSSHAYAADEIHSMTGLEDIVQYLPVRKVVKENDTVVVDGILNNENLAEGYFIRTIGLFAELGSGEEVLFAVTIERSNASYMPEHSETITSIQIKLRIKLDNTENISIIANTGGVATVGDVLDLQNLVESHTSDTVKHVSKAERELWNGALDSAKEYSNDIYQQAAGYTDQKIADLIDGAPETLDTLKEVADAIAENEDVVTALDAAIGTKAKQSELDTHTGNSTIHVTASERTKWNNALPLSGGTLTSSEYEILRLKRTGSDAGVGIKFENSNGTLGSINMSGGIDTGLRRNTADGSKSYTFLDTGNFKAHVTPTEIGALSKESEETQKLNGNISQYASRTEFNSLGWYRIAKYSPEHQNAYQGASSNGCEIILKRSWGNQKGEYHHIELMWTSERTAKFKPVSDISQYSGITAIRLVGDSSSQTAYIDIYYACSQLNAVNIIITNGSTATGYNWEVIAPIQVPESADGITEYASGAIRANSLGCATYDGEGRDIAVNYLKKGDDSANNIVTFTTGDVASPTAWTDVSVLSSGEKHSSILNKISTMFKNVRYTYNTLSGFLSTLKYTNISSYVNYNSSEISSINAWCESGMVVLYVTIKAGTMGAIQFTVTESRYRPTSGGVCGTYASLTTSVDRDKYSGAFISAGGAGTIWIISALANTEFVCFTYPVRFG